MVFAGRWLWLCEREHNRPANGQESGVGNQESDGVRQRCEVEVANPERRHQPSRLARLWPADVLEAVQHQQRTLVPAEVLQRPRNLAVLDEERPVACETGLQHRAGIERANVEEVRDENAAGAAGDDLLRALGAASEREAAGERTTGRTHTLLLGPEACVGEVPQDPSFDPHHATDRQSLHIKRCSEQAAVGWIGIQRYALIDDLLANAVAATCL